MKFSATLNRYLARNYFMNMATMLSILLGIIYLFDTVELLRRASKKGDVGLALVLKMGLFKLPEVGQLLFPFAILFGALFTFWQLSRRQELVVVRSAGFSAWQFLAPVAGVALAVGIMNLAIINPLGATFFGKFESLENHYLSERKSYVTLLKEGLWLRQIESDNSYVILHAGRINLAKWELQDATALFFKGRDQFVRRIDAKRARLADGMWRFEDVISNSAGERTPERLPSVALATDLTVQQLEESFASLEALSFWELPGFINTLEATGFDATPVRIHFQSLLAEPLLFVAMILLAAAVAIRSPRMKGTLGMIASGVVIGFVIFFASSFLQALGASHQIPVFLAAWSPALVTFLLGMAVLLNLEDG